jgi:hypothetical protein
MPSTTNLITGKVIVKESGLGIPDLVVMIYDFDRVDGFEPRNLIKARTGNVSPTFGGLEKLGSVLTESDGSFSLRFEDTDFNDPQPGNQRPDIFMMILSPDDVINTQDPVGKANLLYYNNFPLRENAGRIESFLIRLTKAQLVEGGIPIPDNKGGTVEEEIADYVATQEARFGINTGVTDFNKVVLQPSIDEKKIFREKIKSGIAPEPADVEGSGVFVRDGDRIITKITEITSKGIDKANILLRDDDPDNHGVPVNLYLTPEDREELSDIFGDQTEGTVLIPETRIRHILFRTNSSENFGTLLVNNNPIAKYCHETTIEEQCAMEHLEEEEEPHEPEEPEVEEENGEVTSGDIPGLIGRIISEMPSPDSVNQPGTIPSRPDKEDIEESLDAFSLRKGPAEIPAYYDFHSLQIAFEHVWKQLFDENIVDSGYKLHQDLVTRTGISMLNGDSVSVAEIADVLANVRGTPLGELPAQVAAQFEITREEWQELTNPFQKKLFFIADAINNLAFFTYRGVLIPKRLSVGDEKLRQVFIEQGEKIIDSVRHDDYYTMHKTLRDLHLRLSGNYEYTVFAADKDHYSVNFGILNTFRQEWVPLNYQVGKLCKTIPLAPKEERKYSLKINKHVKRSEKEARKSNSSFTSERSETSRSEAEIIAKALTKTNFNLSTEGTFNIGLAKGSSNTSLGVEAIKDSQQTRRDFREAVVKSVQEYKEERSIEINTEESAEYESNDSGTISNPNDELAVTYLFYELQRRYRISEQLYRITPVVLVAQPVPKPEEITEAWVIAHDWIINKFLLDDSYKHCLEYLSKKSVGDDFAIRELRRNLRQQRNLVEILKLELSMARSRAENRYSALEKAIRERIEEARQETTDGFLSDIGDFFTGGGQDPESAKAMELAAKDAHEYAVEKAEKMASALSQEMDTLHKITAEYNKTLRQHLDYEVQIKRLLVHLRDNIIYYMQAIWSMEPPDQRFLRLQKVQVPHLELDIDSEGEPRRTYEVDVIPSEDVFEMFRSEGTQKHKALMTGVLKKPFTFKALIQVADLDKPLGFKGNYMIFPLKQHNALTEFMAAPYIDAAFGAIDPDELSNLNLNDFSKFICCLHDNDPELFEEYKDELRDWYGQLLADPLRNGDEIVVPSGSLYIEALPAAYPILEDFKLRHRQLDVFKGQAEARKLELENLRYAARLLSDEREDPDVEKKIVVEGNGINANLDVEN